MEDGHKKRKGIFSNEDGAGQLHRSPKSACYKKDSTHNCQNQDMILP